MSWQDIVLSVGSWIFIIALFPSLLGKDKPPVSTSFLTGGILLIYALTYITLHLWLSIASTGILALAWLWLGVQKMTAKNNPPNLPPAV